jgi:hypothetical protein
MRELKQASRASANQGHAENHKRTRQNSLAGQNAQAQAIDLMHNIHWEESGRPSAQEKPSANNGHNPQANTPAKE